MLTEQFINLCCTILLNDNSKFNDVVVNDISSIFSSYEEEDVALQFRKKFSLAKSILKLRSERRPPDQIIDNILSAEHFDELSSFLKALSTKVIPEDKIINAVNQVCEKKRLVQLQRDIPFVEEFVGKFNTSSFTDTSETLQYWEELISKLHSSVLEEKRKEARSNIKELDLLNDNYTDVIDQIELSYSGKNSISTGYNELDGYLNGGHEPTRLYIYGGCSGDGKSVLLNNFVRNSIECNKDTTGPMSMFMYFTMENLIDESLMRLYCSYTNKDIKEVIRNYEYEKTIMERTMKDWQLEHNAMVCTSYFAPTMTSVSDLVAYCDIIQARYEGRAVLRGVYVDYLDLLRSGQVFDIHRLEMGQVTIDMKVAAVTQGVPWVTVTQLNRGAYDNKEMPNLTNMSESIKKVEHADFVGILRNTQPTVDPGADARFVPTDGDFKIIIGKNRSGPKNQIINLKSNFSRFRIDDNGSRGTIPYASADVLSGVLSDNRSDAFL